MQCCELSATKHCTGLETALFSLSEGLHDVYLYKLCAFSQWWAGMCVTMLLLRDRFGCGVTFPLRDFLVCVAVYTENDSGLRTCRQREGEGDGYAGGKRPAP